MISFIEGLAGHYKGYRKRRAPTFGLGKDYSTTSLTAEMEGSTAFSALAGESKNIDPIANNNSDRQAIRVNKFISYLPRVALG